MASFSIISPAFSTRKAVVKVTRKFYTFCNLLIVLNALAFGLLTDISIADRIGPELESFCDLSILIFIVELMIRLSLEKGRFFTGRNRYWNWFDTIIVVLSSAAQLGTFSSFRVFRIFRVFRQLNILRVVRSADKLKLIVEAIFNAIPGMLWTTILFVIIMYTYALLGSTFFGNEFPDWFGNVWRSMYSLFQIMTLESWSMGIARPVMDIYPAAWVYFVTYVLIASYVILNIVVALVVSSLQEVTAKNEAKKSQMLSRDALREEMEKLLWSMTC